MKNSASLSNASAIDLRLLMSACDRLTTPITPSLKFLMFVLPARMSLASVPSSMRSNFVRMQNVRRPARHRYRRYFVDICRPIEPSGSKFIASFSDSLLAKSLFALDTDRMIEFGCFAYLMHKFRMRSSISSGWSWTGIFVMPGRSTNVRFSTLGL